MGGVASQPATGLQEDQIYSNCFSLSLSRDNLVAPEMAKRGTVAITTCEPQISNGWSSI
jgi:hypothetical protein